MKCFTCWLCLFWIDLGIGLVHKTSFARRESLEKLCGVTAIVLLTSPSPSLADTKATTTTTTTTTTPPVIDAERSPEEKEQIRQRLIERRKLMEASRSTNSRQSYLDLSRQRAALYYYNTTYQGVSCPPGIPCL
mmetsp:Transcript_17338/g.47334  ORF Transcript_17338/g.47334 Transcript_17338/m.47334 type:complete len:134 (+) Transcript_17338:1-402(+)